MFYRKTSDTTMEDAYNVFASDYVLLVEEHAGYVYPTHGWYWFATRQEALDFFGIVEEPV